MVRGYADHRGRRWDVVLGRASWGAFYALFVPVHGGEARQTLLAAESSDAAARYLNEVEDRELDELFMRSEPRPIGGPN